MNSLKSNPHYTESIVFEDFVKDLKELYNKDKNILIDFKNYTEKQKEKQRNRLGHTLTTHSKYDTTQSLDMNALLPSSVNIILESRERILANENENVSVFVEQCGWVEDVKVRPEYKITIKRY